MKKIFFFFSCISFSMLNAQLVIETLGTPVTIDFTGFTGSGFQPDGGTGMLNSDIWSATGFSDGMVDFGGTALTGDFARGATGGLETVGGIYGVDIAGNQGLMVQPIADDFTPGSFILKIQNISGIIIGSIDLSYSIYVLNDAARANSFNFSYSYDNVSYTDVADLNYTSPEAMDFTPYIENKSTTISGLYINDGGLLYLRWTGDDVSGTGSRDEFALDDISITGNEDGGAVASINFTAATLTVDESDGTADFILQASEETDCTMHLALAAGGTATDGTDFNYSIPDPLIFAVGEASMAFLNVPIINDVLGEPSETFTIEIQDVSGTCEIGPTPSITITIIDDDDAPPFVSFSPDAITMDEGGGAVNPTVELDASADCTIHVALDAASTADASDVDFVPFDIDFDAGGVTADDFLVNITEDVLDEPDETMILNLSVISGTCMVGIPASFTLTITDNDASGYMVYDIADVTTEDANGVALSDGVKADLTGIVYGINLWDGGLQFTLIDETGGISVFNFDNDFDYVVNEGDEVNIKGTIDQFNGLTEIVADTLIYISSGNELKDPVYVAILDESTESDLIRTGAGIVDFSQWLGDGTSFNVDLDNGMVMRIDNNTELSTMSISEIQAALGDATPDDLGISVLGLGSQYDGFSPFNEDYEIMPRYQEDFGLIEESIESLDPELISIFPNPTSDQLIFSGKENIESVEIINQLGQSLEIYTVNNFNATFSVQLLPAGVYFLKIKTESGIYSSDFIKL